MTKTPWMKFYPSDWRSDPRLRMCSLGARGLWMEMVSLMHEASPYGHLLVSGSPPTDTQLALLAGTSPEQLSDLVGELEAAGVFSRTKEGVIYSRRMTRDEKKRAVARKNGKKGGNPSLCNGEGNRPSDNPRHKGQDKTQKPETRSQKGDTPLTPPERKPDKRRSRIPEDLTPSPANLEAARKRGLSDMEAHDEFERFKNHHLAKGSVMADWNRAWITWLDSPYRRPRQPGRGDLVDAKLQRARERDAQRAASQGRTGGDGGERMALGQGGNSVVALPFARG